ncbi:hypothetical protein CAOG_010073 [Capsaspora owczarzaki ATCC 30864]|uniref:Uncharacterized protein n=1 Tax=Capsaspora owczarzaki (strain ATCC 30864) TaxID=595528 RepID=A0A0D2X519_CAPO3|nr:hypothetical protein CAOG_010073 [Capsaspora owczarzaki ATCC 30864]
MRHRGSPARLVIVDECHQSIHIFRTVLLRVELFWLCCRFVVLLALAKIEPATSIVQTLVASRAARAKAIFIQLVRMLLDVSGQNALHVLLLDKYGRLCWPNKWWLRWQLLILIARCKYRSCACCFGLRRWYARCCNCGFLRFRVGCRKHPEFSLELTDERQ